MAGFLDNVIKDSGNEFASIVSDGVAAGDVTSFVDTGSYIFNAVVSGSLFGGIPSNKVTALAGESSTGKTFFALSVVRSFLSNHPTGGVIYFESESAISKDMIESRGIDSKRMVIFPVATIEEFRTQATRILDKYLKEPKDKRQPLMFVLDSLGMLSTSKEMEDISNDKQVWDMTKSQLIKGAFRVLTLKLGQAQVPMIVTNHTYDVIGSYVPQKEMGGGAGLKYAASTIIYLTLDYPRRVLKLLLDYTSMNVDWSSTTDSLNWVRSTTSLQGWATVSSSVKLLFTLNLFLLVLRSTSQTK